VGEQSTLFLGWWLEARSQRCCFGCDAQLKYLGPGFLPKIFWDAEKFFAEFVVEYVKGFWKGGRGVSMVGGRLNGGRGRLMVEEGRPKGETSLLTRCFLGEIMVAFLFF